MHWLWLKIECGSFVLTQRRKSQSPVNRRCIGQHAHFLRVDFSSLTIKDEHLSVIVKDAKIVFFIYI